MDWKKAERSVGGERERGGETEGETDRDRESKRGGRDTKRELEFKIVLCSFRTSLC